MKRFPPVDQMTPGQFELQVKDWLESVAGPLEDFVATHQDRLVGSDGEYTFDVTAHFRALGGAKFRVLVECKKQKRPVEREVIQILADKQRSVAGTKCIVVTTAGFQSGAITYAATNNIALIQIVSGSAVYIQNSALPRAMEIPSDADDFAGFFYGQDPEGRLFYPQLVNRKHGHELALFLGIAS